MENIKYNIQICEEEHDPKNLIRYFQVGVLNNNNFNGIILDYDGGGQWRDHFLIDGKEVEYDENEDIGEDEAFEEQFTKLFGKDLYKKLWEMYNKIVEYPEDEDYTPFLSQYGQKLPYKKGMLITNSNDLFPITVGMTIFDDVEY